VPQDESAFEDLWHAYQASGDEGVKGELARKFMPTLRATARRVCRALGGHPDVQDLVGAGAVGLLEAFERFDPGRGVAFEAYCMWRVLGAMYDDQRKFDWAPLALRLKAQRLRALADELAAARGHEPSDEELAEALDTTTAEVARARRSARHPAPMSLDRAQGGAARAAEEALVDGRADPARLYAAEEARSMLLEQLRRLGDKQRHVLLLYYFEKLTMAQVGRVLELSESRVCQIHKEALETLVRRLGPDGDGLLEALQGGG
jgi:RNA polymerase sigma factor for flagellar operon FliA